MTIREVEEKTGLARSNIRFYEKEGLLCPRRSSGSEYRNYTEEDVLRLNRIKLLRMLDMPVKTIRECLEGEMSLEEALERQQCVYQEQMDQIHRNQLLCRQLQRLGGDAAALSPEVLRELCGDQETSMLYVEELRKRDRIQHRFYVLQQLVTFVVLCAGVLAMAAYVMDMQYRTVGMVGVAASAICLLVLFGLMGRIIYLNEKGL